MLKESIENINHTFKELLGNNLLATHEAARDLSFRIDTLKSHILQKQKESPILLRPLTTMKMLGMLLKIKKFRSLLKVIEKEAFKNAEALTIDKAIRSLQRKGLLLATTKESCLESFAATLPDLQSLGCKSAFCFRVADREKGKLELLVFSNSGELSSYSYNVKDPVDTQEFLQEKAPSGIPLGQLLDISGWLHKHGAIHAPILSREAIEQKLGKLMKSCPHGAYVMHAQNKALTLSRLSPRGQIEHLIINLQKELGCYTIEGSGSDIAATRTQFKRRLEQMGTPIRLVINNRPLA